MKRAGGLVTGCIVVLVACTSGGEGTTEPKPSDVAASSTTGPEGGLRLVALGDSIVYGLECPGCSLFVDQYASKLSEATGEEVTVDNLAVPGDEVRQLVQATQTQSSMREAIARANAVVVTIGINDLPWNRLDDPCGVAPDYPVVAWDEITEACTDRVTAEYGRDLDAVLAEIDSLREGNPTLLRVTTVYNAVIGNDVDPSWDSPDAVAPSVYANERFVEAQCEAASDHGGECADTYHALNGKTGEHPAATFLADDYTHLAQDGHDAFAEALITTGYAPIA